MKCGSLTFKFHFRIFFCQFQTQTFYLKLILFPNSQSSDEPEIVSTEEKEVNTTVEYYIFSIYPTSECLSKCNYNVFFMYLVYLKQNYTQN